MPETDSNHSKPSVLKSTREAKGLTLEIVHEATKIPMDALRAIEEGYSVRILSPFYYRGFIKIYAEFLGLNVQETYKEYGLDTTAKTLPAPAAAKPSPKDAGPNLLVENLQEWGSGIFTPKTINLFFKALGAFLICFLLFKMGSYVLSHWPKGHTGPKARPAVHAPRQKLAPVHKDEDEVVPAPPSEPKDDKNAPVPAPVPAAVTAASKVVQAPSEDNKVEVAVRAQKNTWLRVKADDRVVFETTLSKGSMESWSADKKIELSGRDLEQLDMEINSKHIGLLGGGERRIRKVLITHEGLTVKK